MIPRAELMDVAEESGLLPTTIERDHALGWILFGIAQHPILGQWLFKGGTCLKKCYFDTYRFSEDLDFSLPAAIRTEMIRDGLQAVAGWVSHAAGLEVPDDGIEVETSENKLGQETFHAKLTFRGALALPRQSRQRIKFDLTHHELVGLPPASRQVFHPYSDLPDPAPPVRCYALEEILAEKTRALVQRAGRARDVYDVVNIGRNFRDHVDVDRTRDLALRKFEYKGLASPTPEGILASIERDVLAADWENALKHQIRVLPPVDEFLAALGEALRWLFLSGHPVTVPASLPTKGDEERVPIETFATPRPAGVRSIPTPARPLGSRMDRMRFAARNRLLANIRYHGVGRLIEPYSLRRPATGNLLLYAFEVRRGSGSGGGIKAYKVAELEDVTVTDQPFRPRYLVEL